MSLVEIEDRVPKHALTTLDVIAPSFAGRYVQDPIPKFKLGESELPAQVAYQVIHEELATESPPFMNLSSFVTTWMEPEADRLIAETNRKNLIDIQQYPVVNQINDRTIAIIADLLHAGKSAFGTSTSGSSEACLLAGIAMKTLWQQRRAAAKVTSEARPNLVISRSGHFMWKQFCSWFQIEYRQVSPEPNDVRVAAASYAMTVDQGTIGVVLILGTTLTGQYEPVRAVADQLQEIEKMQGIQVPIHVDAAIGGFWVPFVDRHIAWDFAVDNVVSINVSGHKFGLTYPGIGWLMFRSVQHCPEHIRYRLDYAASESHYELSLTLTRSAAPVVAQYYNLLRLGRQGYTRVMSNIRSVARYLHDALQQACSDVFRQLNDPSAGLPVLVMTSAEGSDIQMSQLSRVLAHRGWTVPTYEVPYADHHIDVLRIVVREGFSRDHAEMLFNAVTESIEAVRRDEPHAGAKRGQQATRKTKVQKQAQEQARIKHSIC